MSTAEQLLAGGFGVLFVILLFVLFRLARLSHLLREIQEDSEPEDEDPVRKVTRDAQDPPDVGHEAPDEDDTQDRPFWKNYASPVGHEKARPEPAPLPVKQRPPPPDPVSFERAMAAYNELAAHFGQAELKDFERSWHPERLGWTDGDRLAHDPMGDFWLIRLDDADKGRALLVPGPDIVRKWEIYYRSMSSLAAMRLFEKLYDLNNGGPLRLERPAIATETASGWRVDDRGKFADH